MKQKALVIGLDGVPFSMLSALMQQGAMPYLQNLAKQGAFGAMEVTQPPISSVSWTSFATGRAPCHHGIYGFTDITTTHSLVFPTFLDVRCPTLFDTLGTMGKRSVVINLPATYPVRDFPGVLISGFVAPDLARAVHPPALLPTLQRLGYRVDVDLARIRSNPELLYEELHDILNTRINTAELLMNDEPWDLFCLIITGTDRLHHYDFEAWTNSKSSNRSKFISYYNAIDSSIQRICDSFITQQGSDPYLLLFLSDHGFTQLDAEVYCNALLQQHGYLTFLQDTPKMISQLAPATTKAFALDPGRIYVNRSDRFQHGCVSPQDVPALCESLSQLFLDLQCEGRQVFQAVKRRDELYKGPCAPFAPDLVLVPHRGFDPKGALSDVVFKKGRLTGMHTHDDAFWLIAGPATFDPPQTILDCSGILTSFFMQER